MRKPLQRRSSDRFDDPGSRATAGRLGMPSRPVIPLVIMALAALIPSQASATPPAAASCVQNAPVVVATGTGTIGGALCTIEVQCPTSPCTLTITASADGVGMLGVRGFVTPGNDLSCGPALLGCLITSHRLVAGTVTITCDTGASPAAAVAVMLRCSALAS
jgi:hypothetical protein